MLKKISIFSLSLLLSLVAAELGLRAVGALLLKSKTKKEEYSTKPVNQTLAKKNKTAVKVLTLGDSVTFGGWGIAEKSYPSFLNELLSSAPGTSNYTVVNNGMCGNTTRTVLKNLDSLLEFHKPDIIVLLIGAANRYRFQEYDLSTDSENFFEQLRIVKVLSFIQRELRIKLINFIYKNPKTNSNVEKMWITYNPLSRPELLEEQKKLLSSLEESPNSIDILIRLSHVELNLKRFSKAQSYLESALVINPYSNDTRTNIGFLINTIASKKKTPREKANMYLKALKYAPNNSYLTNIIKPLITNFELQSILSTDAIFDVLDQKLENDPTFKDNKSFMSLFWYFKNTDLRLKKIESWIKSDLEKIVIKLKEKNIKLILQNYHVSYLSANSIIEEISKKHSIPLVDNTKTFKSLIKSEEDYKKYIKDDDHCTNEGHKIIAKNVLTEIRKLQ